MIRSVPGWGWGILGGLVVVAEINPILTFLANQMARITAALQEHSLQIAIGAAFIGLVVHLSPWHSEHGWKAIERSAIFVLGVALIPALYPHLQTFAGGALPNLVNMLFNALATGLSGAGL